MTLPEIDHVSFLVEHAQTFFAGEPLVKVLVSLALKLFFQEMSD